MIEDEPNASTEQPYVGGKCGAGYDEPFVGGRCVYAPTALELRGKVEPTFTGTLNADESELSCRIVFPAESTAFCSAKIEGFDLDPIAELLCKDAYVPPIYGGGTGRPIVDCPRSIEVKLAGQAFTFKTKLDKGFGTFDPPLKPDELKKFLADTCKDRYTNEKLPDGRIGRALAVCEALGNDLELTAGTPRCLDKGRVTTPNLWPCTDEKRVINAQCCVPIGKAPPPIPQPMPELPPIVENKVKKVSQPYVEPEPPPPPKQTAADCAAKMTNSACTACCDEVFPNKALGWEACVTPCIGKPL